MMCHGVSLAVGGILLRQCRVFLQISWPNQLWCPNDFFRKNQLPWRQWRPCCKADHPLWPREPSSRFAMSKWRNLNVWLDASELGKWRPPKKGGWKLFKTGAFGNRVDVFLFLFPRCFFEVQCSFWDSSATWCLKGYHLSSTHSFLLGELTVFATPKWLCGWCHFVKANFGWISVRLCKDSRNLEETQGRPRRC